MRINAKLNGLATRIALQNFFYPRYVYTPYTLFNKEIMKGDFYMKRFFILTFLLVLTVSTMTSAEEISINLRTSEKMEALTFLNSISDDTVLSEKYQDVKKEWRSLFTADSIAQNSLKIWMGRGISLSYLFSTVCGNQLSDIIKALGNPDQTFRQMENEFDEPAYKEAFEYLKKYYEELLIYLKFLQQNNFVDFWHKKYSDPLQTAIEKSQQILDRIDTNKLKEMLILFLNKHNYLEISEINIYITAFSGFYGYQLMGLNIGISSDVVENLPFLLSHELCHKFNPSQEILDAQTNLAESDDYYKNSFNRIYHTYREGQEEEYVYAAGLYISVMSNLMTRKGALRKIKFAYYNPQNIGDAGVPLSAIIYEKLLQTPIDSNFDYNRFINNLYKNKDISAGNIQEKYEKIMSDIAGIAGMKIEIQDGNTIVTRLFEGYPAYEAGLKVGDKITKIASTTLKNKSLDEVLDLLAGPKGEKKTIMVERDEIVLNYKFCLK